MINNAARNPLRRSVTINKSRPKGFLKIAREKIKQNRVNLSPLVLNFPDFPKQHHHHHQRSQSTNKLPILCDLLEAPGVPHASLSPSMKFIQKPLGDF